MKNMTKVPKIIIAYELILGLFELISGLGILLFGNKLLDIYNHIRNTELIQDPNDLMVKLTEKLVPNLVSHHISVALLLTAFGVIKISSGIGLIYRKVWAEHLLIVFLIILIPFEIVGLLRHFSLADLGYLVVDVAIVTYLVHFKPVDYLHRLKGDLLPEK